MGEVLRGRLDVEQDKLEDCHREIEIYRQQLEGATQSLDQMKAEMIELKDAHAVKLTSMEASAASQKQEAVNKVILEHEIEMESLRSQMENSEKITDLEAAVKSLQEQVKSKTTEVDTLRGKTRLLEKTQT